MYYRHETGNLGEEEAVKYLLKDDYEIIQRNFNSNFGEIDIIAKDNKKNEIVFIEVKTRSNQRYGNPAEAVDYYKKKHFIKTVEYFIHINKLENRFIRIDIMEVYLSKKGLTKINHLKQAFD
ncbi:MAG: YraN family protein [Oscillospiraceae bacterium]|nr:YraN family protein [Oscillospiraceae bacterium]